MECISIMNSATKNKSPLSVMMLGLRGIPGVQGGVETHCQYLSAMLAKMDCDITVITRSPYQPDTTGPVWENIKIVKLWAPKNGGLEAIVHTFLGVLYAAIKRPDILHIHAIGPGIMTPLARMLGLKVVVTHHGPDYKRQKWGVFARFILKLAERWCMRFANKKIVISNTIYSLVHSQYNVTPDLIPNGVTLPTVPDSMDTLTKFYLTPKKYILLVSRLVPEKRHLDLIAAYQQANIPDWKLVFVGASDHPGDYQSELFKKAYDAGVVLTGYQKGLELQELFSNAGLFVLPSSHEGLPIALLEALSYGLPALVSDIPANLEVGLPTKHYFPLGDIDALAEGLQYWTSIGLDSTASEKYRNWVGEKYDWKKIAQNTLSVYQQV